jgi:serine phosphatase RsbU (regulator of sigma subunit)
MEQSLKRFARRILLLHLVLLAVVLTVIFFASRQVYRSARDQALEQAEDHQSLLVSQTARGLKSYYDSIFSDLDLFRPVSPDDEDVDDRVPRVEADLPYKTTGNRAFRISPMLALQLNGRVSHLFLVEKQTLLPHTFGKQSNNPTVQQLIERNRDWIDHLNASTISNFRRYGDRGFNLIGVPVGPKRNFVFVATVPMRSTSKWFLDDINRSEDGSASRDVLLLDEGRTVMSSSRPDLVGATLAGDIEPDPTPAAIAPQQERAISRTLAKPFTIGDQHFAASMVTAQPIRVLDKQWSVMIVYPMAKVDAVVSRLFRQAVLWAIFVAVSVTGILVSTAIHMIRTRIRAERLRHQVLDRELRQAREIQLAWLPKRGPRRQSIDIATANHPASRISGDFYNWFDLPDGRTCVVIGDVTGHGMSAAFLMATAQLLVRNTMPQTGDPGRCLEEVNRQLCTQMFNGQFVTLLILVIDAPRGRVEVATAGHPAPLLGDGESFQPLPLEPNLVLGVENDSPYPSQSFELSPHSTLLLYTDGVLDATSPAGERFGHERLRRRLYGSFDSAQHVVDALVESVTGFRSGCDLCDDLTLVAIQLQPTPAAQPALVAAPA